ncbi:uncharacterized protein LOC106664798 [Cimex lectularius]|uniref:Uncharacterized protein n=1 Tax=Cimex lectularius TaxID=79782 RepID=A0A8I6RJL3_CIMLE|nr:uncharacterized protein LOC106664798 [Cimex lectularius]
MDYVAEKLFGADIVEMATAVLPPGECCVNFIAMTTFNYALYYTSVLVFAFSLWNLLNYILYNTLGKYCKVFLDGLHGLEMSIAVNCLVAGYDIARINSKVEELLLLLSAGFYVYRSRRVGGFLREKFLVWTSFCCLMYTVFRGRGASVALTLLYAHESCTPLLVISSVVNEAKKDAYIFWVTRWSARLFLVYQRILIAGFVLHTISHEAELLFLLGEAFLTFQFIFDTSYHELEGTKL